MPSIDDRNGSGAHARHAAHAAGSGAPRQQAAHAPRFRNAGAPTRRPSGDAAPAGNVAPAGDPRLQPLAGSTSNARPATGPSTQQFETLNSSAIQAPQSVRVLDSHERSVRAGQADTAADTRRKTFIYAGIGALALVLFLGMFFFLRPLWHKDAKPEVEKGVEVQVVVPDGAGGQQIAELLIEAGVIDSASAFNSEVNSQNAEMSLKSGSYKFVTGMNPKNVVRQLVDGPNDLSGKLTVPEGLTVQKTADLVEQTLGIPAADFVAAAKASSYVGDYPFLSEVNDDSLEGYLCPKTYDFSGRNASAEDVIRAMLAQWQTDFGGLDWEGSRATLQQRFGIEFSNYDIVRMASYIEREATTAEDRPLVSSVFYNRMAAGMALQSDATMSYVTGGSVTSEDLQSASPYNTYIHKGFTPTPICTPSIECLQAAMDPAYTNYLFFYIVDDGERSIHEFTETYDEHLGVIDAAGQSGQSEQE